MSNQQSSLRESLKLLTKPLHDHLESAPILSFLHNESINTKEYAELLVKMYQFFSSLEVQIKKFEKEFEAKGLDDIAKRFQRCSWLEADLKELDIELPQKKEIEFISLNSFDSVVGALYVCEGSTMGGMQITKILSAKLATPLSLNFYNGYGEMTMPMWQNYCKFLDSVKFNEANCVLGACEIYLKLGETLRS